MLRIEPYDENYRAAFTEMFTVYNRDDLHMQDEDPRMTDAAVREKIAPFFIRQAERGIARIRLAVDGEIALGFAVFQIDRPESDWCKRLGWGFIREFYVDRLVRRQGVGRLLAAGAEEELRAMGARRLYLTTDTAGAFWEACGYRPSGKKTGTGLLIYEK